MFEIKYKIIDLDDDIKGLDGFFQIICNECTYGEFYPDEIEKLMDRVSIYDWMNYLLDVVLHMDSSKISYVLLNDTESYNKWIELEKINNKLFISILDSYKLDGIKGLEFIKPAISNYTDWKQQVCEYNQFKDEVVKKAEKYVSSIIKLNQEYVTLHLITDIEEKLRKLENRRV